MTTCPSPSPLIWTRTPLGLLPESIRPLTPNLRLVLLAVYVLGAGGREGGGGDGTPRSPSSHGCAEHRRETVAQTSRWLGGALAALERRGLVREDRGFIPARYMLTSIGRQGVEVNMGREGWREGLVWKRG